MLCVFEYVNDVDILMWIFLYVNTIHILMCECCGHFDA